MRDLLGKERLNYPLQRGRAQRLTQLEDSIEGHMAAASDKWREQEETVAKLQDLVRALEEDKQGLEAQLAV